MASSKRAAVPLSLLGYVSLISEELSTYEMHQRSSLADLLVYVCTGVEFRKRGGLSPTNAGAFAQSVDRLFLRSEGREGMLRLELFWGIEQQQTFAIELQRIYNKRGVATDAMQCVLVSSDLLERVGDKDVLSHLSSLAAVPLAEFHASVFAYLGELLTKPKDAAESEERMSRFETVLGVKPLATTQPLFANVMFYPYESESERVSWKTHVQHLRELHALDPKSTQWRKVIISEGKKNTKPLKHGRNVMVSYEGRFPNGEVFDANKACVFRLMAQQMIIGFDAAVASMKLKEQAWIYIPPPAAYGEAGVPPTIGPNQTLIFKVELKQA